MKIVVTNNLTLDGVMQSPGHPDEDRRGGFEHGGWAPPYADQVMGEEMGKGIAQGGALLFGRRTYEKMRAAWEHGPQDSPFTAVLNERRKYVASRTLDGADLWQNTVLLEGDAADAVADLRAQPGPDVVILGSGELVRALLARDLIDRLVLCLHPLVLGQGLRLFEDGTAATRLRLADARPTTTGVIIATYEPAG